MSDAPAIPLDPAQLRARRRRLLLTAMIVATAMFMEMVDGTVIATALPAMARSFNADPLHMNVALTSYLLSLAVFIPVSGTTADRFGARTVFGSAIALFTLGSILCGQADTLWFLIAARIIQGIGGAMMVPVGRLVLLRTVSKSELVSAMTWLMIPATIGPVLGPPIGGFIVTYLNWRWIFDINVPIGVIGLIMVVLFIDDVKEPAPGPFDFLGFVYSGISLACLIFGIELASRGVGSLIETAALIAVGVVSGVLYWRRARGHPSPVLDFKLMRIPTFRISVFAGSLSRIAVGAMPFLLPMMMQIGFGLSAAQSGMITFAGAAGSMLMRVGARPLLRRFGFRSTLIWIGLLSTLLLATTAAFRPSWPIAAIYAVLFVGGFFQSLQFMVYNTICYADIPRQRMSSATSFYTTFQQLCLSLGIATAAAALSAATALSGRTVPGLWDFSVAFIAVSLIALLAPLVSRKLEPDAGAELSGQQTAPANTQEPVAAPGPATARVLPPPARPEALRPAVALPGRSRRAVPRRGRA
jgi:EmrB/QacA subfamily drug resistance transporter